MRYQWATRWPLLLLPFTATAGQITCTPPGMFTPPQTFTTRWKHPMDSSVQTRFNQLGVRAQYKKTGKEPYPTLCPPSVCALSNVTATSSSGAVTLTTPLGAEGVSGAANTRTAEWTITATLEIKPGNDGGAVEGAAWSLLSVPYDPVSQTSWGPTDARSPVKSLGVAPPTIAVTLPDVHDFGEVTPGSISPNPLVLSTSAGGFLTGLVSWSGPNGTQITYTGLPSGNGTAIPQGTPTPLPQQRTGYKLDLQAAPSATPGAVAGSITVTLGCP